MGRTNPTFRDVLGRFEDRLSAFRRGLRRRYQADFDRLLEGIERHADAAGYMNADDPQLAILVSALLAHETRLRELRDRLDDLEE